MSRTESTSRPPAKDSAHGPATRLMRQAQQRKADSHRFPGARSYYSESPPFPSQVGAISGQSEAASRRPAYVHGVAQKLRFRPRCGPQDEAANGSRVHEDSLTLVLASVHIGLRRAGRGRRPRPASWRHQRDRPPRVDPPRRLLRRAVQVPQSVHSVGSPGRGRRLTPTR